MKITMQLDWRDYLEASRLHIIQPVRIFRPSMGEFFRKWWEDQKLLLLYLSDILYIPVHKRFLSDQHVAEIRTRLRENSMMDANRPHFPTLPAGIRPLDKDQRSPGRH